MLHYKFNLSITVQSHENRPVIYIKSESMPVLRAIVGPFMSTGMLYKLGELKTKPVSLPR